MTSSNITSLMSIIDDIKDKINDGEYLKMCNLLKLIDEEIKEKNNNKDEEEEDEEDIGYFYLIEDKHFTIEEIIREFDDNFRDVSNTLIIKIAYNNMLRRIYEHYQINYDDNDENNNRKFFVCKCGTCLRTSFIPEHLNDNIHCPY